MIKSSFLEDLNARAISQLDLRKVTILLPVGACENHSSHLPFSSDSIMTRELAKKIAEDRENTIILPTIGYGESSDHMQFPMTITLSAQTLEQVVFEILNCAAKSGVKRFLVLNGHDGNSGAIASAAKRVRDHYPDVVVANFEWWKRVYDFLDPNLFTKWGGHGHAGESETSIMLHLRSNLVDMNSAPGDVEPSDITEASVFWSIDKHSAHGGEGAPRLATDKKGAIVFSKCVELLKDFLAKMDERNWQPRTIGSA
jgi:creatinine amidohydrolase/Fe(II)-dependent formamide hydrolase-like protein